jgi:hypothetical protein
MVDFKSVAVRNGGTEHFESFLDGVGIGFGGIGADGDNQTVEHFKTSLDHPDMAIGWWIERTSVDCDAHDGSVAGKIEVWEKNLTTKNTKDTKGRFFNEKDGFVDSAVADLFNERVWRRAVLEKIVRVL